MLKKYFTMFTLTLICSTYSMKQTQNMQNSAQKIWDNPFLSTALYTTAFAWNAYDVWCPCGTSTNIRLALRLLYTGVADANLLNLYKEDPEKLKEILLWPLSANCIQS